MRCAATRCAWPRARSTTPRSATAATYTDDEVAAVLAREVKTRRESVEAFRKGGREDLAAKEEAEIAILAEFLPEQLSEAEIAALVDEAIAATGAAGPRDMGKVMGWLAPRTRGRADGRLVSQVVGQALAACGRRHRDRRQRRDARHDLGSAHLPEPRELVRLLVAFGGLVLAMTLTSGSTCRPASTSRSATSRRRDIAAPRALTFTNELLTTQARQAARDNVEPQYDFTSERAITIAAEQLTRVHASASRRSTPRSRRRPRPRNEQAHPRHRAAGPSATTRATILADAAAASAGRPVRTEAARVLDVTERDELRDTEVAEARERLSAQMAGGLSDDERTLAAELIAPAARPEQLVLGRPAPSRSATARRPRSRPSSSRSSRARSSSAAATR